MSVPTPKIRLTEENLIRNALKHPDGKNKELFEAFKNGLDPKELNELIRAYQADITEEVKNRIVETFYQDYKAVLIQIYQTERAKRLSAAGPTTFTPAFTQQEQRERSETSGIAASVPFETMKESLTEAIEAHNNESPQNIIFKAITTQDGISLQFANQEMFKMVETADKKGTEFHLSKDITISAAKISLIACHPNAELDSASKNIIENYLLASASLTNPPVSLTITERTAAAIKKFSAEDPEFKHKVETWEKATMQPDSLRSGGPKLR